MGSNSTEVLPNPPFWFDILRGVLLSTSIFFIITGNIFCSFVIRGSPQMRKVSRIFILSLIIADLCAGAFSGGALLVTLIVAHWIIHIVSEVLCKLYFITGILFNGASFISLLMVIIDCYVAIEKPLRYPSILTARRAYTITITIWIVMLGVAVAYGVSFGAVRHFEEAWHWCILDMNFYKNDSYLLLLILYCLFTVILPLAVTVCIYARIRQIVSRHMARLARITPAGHPFHHRSNDSKSLTTFLIVSCGVALTSLPLSIIMLYSHWTGDYSIYGTSAAMVLRSCNNLLNVFVHIRRNKEFRTTATRILCRRRNRGNESSGTATNSTQLSNIASLCSPIDIKGSISIVLSSELK